MVVLAKIRFLTSIFVSSSALILFIFWGVNQAQAANCTQSSEGLAGIDILTFNKAIVPCGRSCDDGRTPYNEESSCTLCHLLIMAKNIFDLMFAWIIILAILSLTIGGVVYLLSVGNPGTATFAKGIITKTLMGFAGFLLAWLFVYTILVFLSANTAFLGVNSGGHWYEFDCVTDSVFD